MKEDPEKILARRLELIEEIHDLTQSQREAVQSERWEDLKIILIEKDRWIQQFQETEKSLKGWNPLRLKLKGVPSLGKDLKRIESKLLAVQSVERECARLLNERKREAAKVLQEFKRAREGIKRFKSRGRGAPRFVDLRK